MIDAAGNWLGNLELAGRTGAQLPAIARLFVEIRLSDGKEQFQAFLALSTVLEVFLLPLLQQHQAIGRLFFSQMKESQNFDVLHMFQTPEPDAKNAAWVHQGEEESRNPRRVRRNTILRKEERQSSRHAVVLRIRFGLKHLCG